MTIRSFACICLPGKRTRKFPILIAAIFVLATNGVSHAQLDNPLRFGKTERNTTEQANAGAPQHSPYQPNRDRSTAKSTMPPEVYAAIYNTNVDRPVGEPGPIVDQQVAAASYEATPKNDLAPIARMLESLPNQTGTTNQASRREASSNVGRNGSLPEPAADPFTANPGNEMAEADSGTVPPVKKFDREKFQTLIKHLAINTGIVMCCGIGFILIAKQYFKGKSPGKSKQLKPGIEITSTLRLSPKSNLHLIEAGDQRLIVAMDQNGIRSVVRLTESFAHTLDSLEDLVTDSGSSASDSISAVMGAAGAVEVDDAGTYSLGAIGRTRGQSRQADASETRIQAKRPVREREESGSADNREDEVRRQMEAALSDHGLKELFLETLRKQ